MTLVISSFLAGVLSVLAPCAISMIPILLARNSTAKSHNAVWIISGLGGSVFVFSLLLKASTILIDVPTQFWQVISGSIIFIFGLSSLFPKLWENIGRRLKLQTISQKIGRKGFSGQPTKLGDVLIGASLGPVFSSCSPTYALIVATILPSDFVLGIVYLFSFVAGLSGMLLLVAFGGKNIISKLQWSLDPNGAFRKILGIIMIIIGIFIATGLDKDILSWMVEQGWFDWQVNLENNL